MFQSVTFKGILVSDEPRHEKTCLRSFYRNGAVRPQKKTRGLHFGFRKKKNSTFYAHDVAKTKALISYTSVFVYVKSRFSHNGAGILHN